MTEKDWIKRQVRLLFGARPPMILECRVVARSSVTAYGEEEGGGVEERRVRRRGGGGGGEGKEEETGRRGSGGGEIEGESGALKDKRVCEL